MKISHKVHKEHEGHKGDFFFMNLDKKIARRIHL
jgi:hypothetical protein